MNFILKTIILLSFISMKAQVEPFLDYTWTIEEIITADEVITADMDPEYIDDVLYLDQYEGNTYGFYLGECDGVIEFDDNDQSFILITFGCAISGEGIIGTYFTLVFLAQEEDEIIYEGEAAFGPFAYDFREDGDIIYLDITNSLGDIATFWASTLRNDKFDEADFSIFPNPVGNHLNIQGEDADIENIEIYNLSGKQVLQPKYNPNEAIDVSSLAKGLYVLKVQTENGSFTKKLVKE
jgi:hypothetical protein